MRAARGSYRRSRAVDSQNEPKGGRESLSEPTKRDGRARRRGSASSSAEALGWVGRCRYVYCECSRACTALQRSRASRRRRRRRSLEVLASSRSSVLDTAARSPPASSARRLPRADLCPDPAHQLPGASWPCAPLSANSPGPPRPQHASPSPGPYRARPGTGAPAHEGDEQQGRGLAASAGRARPESGSGSTSLSPPALRSPLQPG